MPSSASFPTGITLLHPTVTVAYADGHRESINGIAGMLLARLAVAPGEAVTRAELEQLGWPEGGITEKSLSSHLKKVRAAVPGTIPTAERNARVYSINASLPVDVPALIQGLQNVDEGSTGDIDRLLALCRGEPDFVRGQRWWAPVCRARERLLRLITALPETDRRELRHLDAFLRAHSDLVPPWITAPRKTLLIVEDNKNLRDSLYTMLRPRFDCTLVDSFDQWMEITEDGPPAFDGALVDRHLTMEGSDDRGLHVLEYLKLYTKTRTILMTADPPEGFEADAQRKYGVLGVYTKGGGHGVANVKALIDLLFPPTLMLRR